MSKAIFDKLPKNHQDILVASATSLRPWQEGRADDDID